MLSFNTWNIAWHTVGKYSVNIYGRHGWMEVNMQEWTNEVPWQLPKGLLMFTTKMFSSLGKTDLGLWDRISIANLNVSLYVTEPEGKELTVD